MAQEVGNYLMWPNVHPVSSAAGIQTNDHLIMSLILKPLDQGSRQSQDFFMLPYIPQVGKGGR